MQYFKSFIGKNKQIASNLNYLSILQFFQLLIPLITYPYLIRVLGSELYGLVVYANSIAFLFQIFINFGFEVSEIREISIWRDDAFKISEILSSVIFIKTIIAVFSVIVLISCIYLFPPFNEYKLLFLATSGILIDSALNPRFFFQGIEKMKLITILTVASKLFFLFLIFVMVKSPNDYVLVPLLNSLGLLMGSLIGLFIINLRYGLYFVTPKKVKVVQLIKDSLPFFFSRLSVLIINRTSIILLGTFVGFKEVSYFDLAEKFITVLKMPFDIFNQVLYPNVSKSKNVSIVTKSIKYLAILYLPLFLILFIIVEPLIVFIGGENLIPSKYILYILAISIFTELGSVLMGAPMLLALGYKKQFNESIIWGSLVYLIVISLLFFFDLISAYTLAMTTVLSSGFILCYRFYYLKKFKII